LLDAVLDLAVDLGSGQGTVDTGGSLGGVASEEACRRQSQNALRSKLCSDLGTVAELTLLIQNNHIAASKVDGVRSTQAGHCDTN
jgi:hypothetical protein